MKISARNVLKGKVKAIREGTVNAEVVLELSDGQEIVAMVTKASAQALGLAIGQDAMAIVKASNVMVGVE